MMELVHDGATTGAVDEGAVTEAVEEGEAVTRGARGTTATVKISESAFLLWTIFG